MTIHSIIKENMRKVHLVNVYNVTQVMYIFYRQCYLLLENFIQVFISENDIRLFEEIKKKVLDDIGYREI